MKKIIKIAILLWFLLAVFRLGPHIRRLIFEEPYWLSLNNSQKKAIIFADLGRFYNEVEAKLTCPKNIAYLAPGSKAKFLAYYYFYPCQVTIVQNVDEAQKIKNSDYLLVLKSRDPGIDEFGSWQWSIESLLQKGETQVYYESFNSKGFLIKLK